MFHFRIWLFRCNLKLKKRSWHSKVLKIEQLTPNQLTDFKSRVRDPQFSFLQWNKMHRSRWQVFDLPWNFGLSGINSTEWHFWADTFFGFKLPSPFNSPTSTLRVLFSSPSLLSVFFRTYHPLSDPLFFNMSWQSDFLWTLLKDS